MVYTSTRRRRGYTKENKGGLTLRQREASRKWQIALES